MEVNSSTEGNDDQRNRPEECNNKKESVCRRVRQP